MNACTANYAGMLLGDKMFKCRNLFYLEQLNFSPPILYWSAPIKLFFFVHYKEPIRLMKWSIAHNLIRDNIRIELSMPFSHYSLDRIVLTLNAVIFHVLDYFISVHFSDCLLTLTIIHLTVVFVFLQQLSNPSILSKFFFTVNLTAYTPTSG